MKNQSKILSIITIVVLIVAMYFIVKQGSDNNKNANGTGAITDGNSEDTIKSQYIILKSPKGDEEISASNITLSGEAKVYENTINYRIIDANDKTLAQGFGTTDNNGIFSIKVMLEKTTAKKGTIEIYEISPKDGSKSNIVKTNILFKQNSDIK